MSSLRKVFTSVGVCLIVTAVGVSVSNASPAQAATGSAEYQQLKQALRSGKLQA